MPSHAPEREVVQRTVPRILRVASGAISGSAAVASREERIRRDMRRRRILAAADTTSLLLAILFLTITGAASNLRLALELVATWPIWLLIANVTGLYNADHRELRHLTVDELPALIAWVTLSSAVSCAVVALVAEYDPSLTLAVRLWASLLLIAPLLRAFARYAWRRVTPPERLLIVGSDRLEHTTRRKLELYKDIHARVVGAINDARVADLDVADIDALIREGFPPAVDRIVIASTTPHEALIGNLISICQLEHIKLTLIAPVRGTIGTAVRLARVADLPMIEYSTWDIPRSTMALKRAIDVIVAAFGLLLLAGPTIWIVLAIRLEGPGPILFRQRRAGREGRPFRMLKFRTMVPDAEARLHEVVELDKLKEPAFKVENDPRVTRVGRFLRKTSLDELPQLVNVLHGHMSLVGPRPEQLDVVALYAPEHRFRLDVRPGITGPMQVYGRGRLRFDERLAVERDYIENMSLGNDFRIAVMTLAAVMGGEGAH
jgi:exopolysaccharide biosynthesis polyprenyl glycosylphosphotransferase